MMQERGIEVNYTTTYRWVQRYAPQLDKQCRLHLKPTNDSWRVDETYIKVKGKWKYLYRAVDSAGNTLDFLLCAKRDGRAAKRFLSKALRSNHCQSPRVINVDKNPAYPKAIKELMSANKLPNTCKLRQSKYLNNMVEQDHRFIKRLTNPGLGFASFNTARRTLKGYETMNMIRKGQIVDVEKRDILAQVKFIAQLFGVAA